jgi:hypothetical protein
MRAFCAAVLASTTFNFAKLNLQGNNTRTMSAAPNYGTVPGELSHLFYLGRIVVRAPGEFREGASPKIQIIELDTGEIKSIPIPNYNVFLIKKHSEEGILFVVNFGYPPTAQRPGIFDADAGVVQFSTGHATDTAVSAGPVNMGGFVAGWVNAELGEPRTIADDGVHPVSFNHLGKVLCKSNKNIYFAKKSNIWRLGAPAPIVSK